MSNSKIEKPASFELRITYYCKQNNCLNNFIDIVKHDLKKSSVDVKHVDRFPVDLRSAPPCFETFSNKYF